MTPFELRHQKGKRARSEEIAPLLVVLHLLVVVGLIITIIVIIINTSRTNTKGCQFSWSQRGIRGGDGWEDRDVRELKKRLIALTVDNLLVVSNYLKALIHHIQALICTMTRDKDTSKHLQDIRVGARGRGGTTASGSEGRSDS
jgi:putative flippase GtrA